MHQLLPPDLILTPKRHLITDDIFKRLLLYMTKSQDYMYLHI